jgi:hypothetical protein
VNIPAPSWFPEYTDVEGYRKYSRVLEFGELVVYTEKIHGANLRVARDQDGVLWVGSHHNFKARPKKGEPGWWWGGVLRGDEFGSSIADRLPGGYAFYGEVYGHGVQRGFPYDAPVGQVRVRFFDARDLSTGRYLDWDHFKNLCTMYHLPLVPELWRGSHEEGSDPRAMAEGPTTLGGGHVREGWVVRPLRERYHDRVGRVILKMPGEGYLIARGKEPEPQAEAA